MTDLSQYKSRLREYLVARGVQITRDGSTEVIRCISGKHEDKHPSMAVYDDGLYCFACGTHMDIFEAAGALASVSDFPSKKAEVFRVLNIEEAPYDQRTVRGSDANAKGSRLSGRPELGVQEENPGKQRSDKPSPPLYISLSLESARAIYTPGKLLDLAEKSLHWRPSAVRPEFIFKSLSPEGTIDLLEVRYEGHPDGKKKYLTYWYDGKNVRTSSPPILLYNRDKLASDTYRDWPVLIHEGPKCIFIAEKYIDGFIHTGWNSGGKKFELVDWSILGGRDVFIYPDDDGPGRDTAVALAKLIGNGRIVRIVEPLQDARSIKSGGADIVEALQVRTPEELAEYIRSGPELKEDDDAKERSRPTEISRVTQGNARASIEDSVGESRNGDSGNEDISGTGDSGRGYGNKSGDDQAHPFKILGRADDGLTYFLDQFGYLQKSTLKNINQDFLRVLAPFGFWFERFNNEGAMSKPCWQKAIEKLTQSAGPRQFDIDRLRGRGAWRTRSGDICFHDGVETLGTTDPACTYVKRTQVALGLSGPQATAEQRRAILDVVSKMSFDSKADTVRALAWSVLAPFGGALPWRNAAILTGDSGSGKSTLLQFVIVPLVKTPLYFTGEATAAGGRQTCGTDSLPFIIDEAAGDKSEASERRRREWFSLMQQSTSDDSPKVVKGTPSQDGAISYLMRQMFLFAAVTPDTGSVEQDNRIFSINLVKPDGENGTQVWTGLAEELKKLLSDDICAAVRSFTWAHLGEILATAEDWRAAVHEFPPHDTRKAYAEALLFAAFWIVFLDRVPEAQELADWLGMMYELKAPEEKRNEPTEMLERILREGVAIFGDRGNQLSLGSILGAIHSRKHATWNQTLNEETESELDGNTILNYRRTAWLYGLGVNTKGEIAILSKHPKINQILRTDHDYIKTLRRHPGYVKKSGDKPTQAFSPYKGEKAQQCTFIAGVLEECPF
jgi:hypothetical protein